MVRRRLRRFGCGLAVLLLVLAAPTAAGVRQWRLRRHPALARAVEFLLDQDETRDALGADPRVAGWITAKVQEWPSRGDADLIFTLRGAKGTVTARVELIKSLGEWGVQSAGITPPGEHQIDLSPEQPDFGPAPEEPPEKLPAAHRKI